MRLPTRAVAITIKEDKVLLMWRKRKNWEYYIFPGGGVEGEETKEEAVTREAMEETSIKVSIVKQIYHLHYTKDGIDNSDHYFYLCRYLSGEPKLGDFNEKKEMENGRSLYKPRWVLLKDIPKMILYPIEIRDWLVEDLKNDFQKTPREMTIKIEELKNA